MFIHLGVGRHTSTFSPQYWQTYTKRNRKGYERATLLWFIL